MTLSAIPQMITRSLRTRQERHRTHRCFFPQNAIRACPTTAYIRLCIPPCNTRPNSPWSMQLTCIGNLFDNNSQSFVNHTKHTRNLTSSLFRCSASGAMNPLLHILRFTIGSFIQVPTNTVTNGDVRNHSISVQTRSQIGTIALHVYNLARLYICVSIC